MKLPGLPYSIGKPRVALVLSSGSARGWAHAGVIQELTTAGINIDIVTGTSFGALVGAHFASGSLERMMHFSRKLDSYRSTLSYLDFSPGRGGMFKGDTIREILEETLYVRTFKELSIPFGVVAVDLVTMKEVHFFDGPLIPALRASISIPGFLTPAEEGQHQFVDGALLNPLPVNIARKLGADLILGVDVRLEDRMTRSTSTTTVLNRSIDVMLRRIREANQSIDPPDLLIRPDMSEIGFWDYHRIEEAVERGRQAARKSIPAIQSLLRRSFFIKKGRGAFTGGKLDSLVFQHRFQSENPSFLEEPEVVQAAEGDVAGGVFQILEARLFTAKKTPGQTAKGKKRSG